jgi:hypothetical protein
MTLEEQALAIANNTDRFVFINDSLLNEFRHVLLLAALAFDDDDTLEMDGDIAEVKRISAGDWPYVATQLEIGLNHSGLELALRSQWEVAIKGVARIAGHEFPYRRDGIDMFIPF